MRRPVTDIEVTYEQVDVSPDDSQRRLNEMFDVLFEETSRYLQGQKQNAMKNQMLKGGDKYE